MGKKYNVKIGEKYGKLTILEIIYSEKRSRNLCKCKCDCGTIVEYLIEPGQLIKGKIVSCGCKRKEKTHTPNLKLVGRKINAWSILEASIYKNNKQYWKCKCDCGTIKDVSESNLLQNRSKSCGCLKENKPGPLFIDLTGKKFGRLVASEYIKNNNGTKALWKCKCDCGNEIITESSSLRKGITKSCGCIRHEYLDTTIIGKKFGKLTVIEFSHMNFNDSYWKCKCDCGEEKIVNRKNLRTGYTISCGCLSESSGCFKTRTCVEKFLENTELKVTKEKTFETLINPLTNRHLYFDLVIKHKNQFLGLIEYDGEQHFKEIDHFTGTLKEQQYRDNIKNEYAKNNNLPLLRISYKDYLVNSAEEKIKQFLQNILNNFRTP
jgi:hypothetical protein